MSQNQTPYATDAPPTLAAFKNRPCALPFADKNYAPPNPEEVTQLIKLAGWSQRQAAELVGVKFDEKKGSTTIRKWRTARDKQEHREIPYAAWRLFLISAGIVER